MEAVRLSRSVIVPGALKVEATERYSGEATDGYGVQRYVDEVHFTRVTLTLRMDVRGAARQWRRFLERHETQIKLVGDADEPYSGLLVVRVEAMSALLLQMEADAKMGRLPIVGFEYCSRRIPRTGGGQGAVKVQHRVSGFGKAMKCMPEILRGMTAAAHLPKVQPSRDADRVPMPMASQQCPLTCD